MRIATVLVVAALLAVIMPSFDTDLPVGRGAAGFSLLRTSHAEEGWKQEFDDICGSTDESMGMTKEQLKSLLARCEKLKPLIESQEETARKVYLKRLQMCRDLLAYVLEVKNKD